MFEYANNLLTYVARALAVAFLAFAALGLFVPAPEPLPPRTRLVVPADVVGDWRGEWAGLPWTISFEGNGLCTGFWAGNFWSGAWQVEYLADPCRERLRVADTKTNPCGETFFCCWDAELPRINKRRSRLDALSGTHNGSRWQLQRSGKPGAGK